MLAWLLKRCRGEPGLEDLMYVKKRLRLAYAKLSMAQSFVSNRDVRRNLIASAILTGSIAVMPDFMHSLYIKSAVSEIRKALKRVKTILAKEHRDDRRVMLKRLLEVLTRAKDSSIRNIYEIILEAQSIVDFLLAMYS